MTTPALSSDPAELNGSVAALASHGQRQLWLFDQLYGGSAAYNIAVTLRLTGRLDADVLRRTLNEIIRRHESLRTNLVDADGELMQIIAPALPLDLPLIDLSGTRRSPLARSATAAPRTMGRAAVRPGGRPLDSWPAASSG